MPPSKDHNAKQSYGRSFSHNEMSMSAKVYQPATNLLPPTPPHSPSGVSHTFPFKTNTNSWSRQNSQNNGKYH